MKAHHKKAKRTPSTKDGVPSAPTTVFVFWLDEGYGYAFKSVEQYRRLVTSAAKKLLGDATMVPQIDASALDLAKFVKVRAA